MTKDRRLGKGLAALLGGAIESTAVDASDSDPAQTPSATDTPKSPSGFTVLAVSEIDNNPYQPRRYFDEEQLVALSQSLKQHDLLQPIVVRPKGARYELISGERRLRAAIMAANEVQAEHERKVVYLPPRPLPSSITISSPNPAAAQPLAAGLVSPYGYPPAAAAPAPVEEALPGGGNAGIAAAAASAMGVGAMPMLAAAGAPQGLAMGAGTSFVPDPPSGQTLAGYVEGTMYVPE